MTTLLAVVCLALATFSGLTVYVVRAVLSHRIYRASTVPDSVVKRDWSEDVDALNYRMDNLALAVEEGIRRVDRAENRIQKTVTSARRLVRENGLEHAGIEAEFAELESPNAEGIPALPPVPEPVAGARTVRIPGGHLQIGAA